MFGINRKKLLIIFLVPLVLVAAAWTILPVPGQVPILMYHFVGEKDVAAEYKNFVSEESFARQMAFLDFFKYRVISMDELYEIKTGQRKPRGREIAITFDDANYSFKESALPILEKYRFPVAVFAVSESASRGIHGSMTLETLQELSRTGWITIGSHSKTHPLLSRMSDEQIQIELEDSKKDLEAALGVPVYYMAYPSSDIDERVLRIAEDTGYRLAFATSIKKIRGLKPGLYNLTRDKISRSADIFPVFWIKVSGIYSFVKKQRENIRNLF